LTSDVRISVSVSGCIGLTSLSRWIEVLAGRPSGFEATGGPRYGVQRPA
jgi:hypothetical protein